MSYPCIGDHGFIGDLQTAALVATYGAIEDPRGSAIVRAGMASHG